MAGAIITAGACNLASASLIGLSGASDIVFNGCTNGTWGSCSVTEFAGVGGQAPNQAFSGPTNGTSMNVVSPTSLFTFDNFGNLGIANATLTGGDFDYVFHNSLTSLTVTNLSGEAATNANVTITTTPVLDPASTMVDKADVVSGLNVTTDGSTIYSIAATGFQSIAASASYTYPGLPVVWQDSISGHINPAGAACKANGGLNYTSCFGNTTKDFTLGSDNPLSDYAASGTYSIGLTDAASYSVSFGGNAGSGNVGVQFTTLYDALAEVTYAYTIPDPSAAPEPATMGLFGLGLLGVGILGRKYKKG